MYGMNFVSEVLSEIKIKSIQMSQYLCYNKSTEQWNECGEQLGSFNEKSEFKMRSWTQICQQQQKSLQSKV